MTITSQVWVSLHFWAIWPTVRRATLCEEAATSRLLEAANNIIFSLFYLLNLNVGPWIRSYLSSCDKNAESNA